MKRLLLLLLLGAASAPAAQGNDNDDSNAARRRHILSRLDLSKILHTSLEDEATLQHYANRHLQEAAGNDGRSDDEVWDRLVQHGWTWSKRAHSRGSDRPNDENRRNLRSGSASIGTATANSEEASSNSSPFLICSSAPNQSGYQRRSSIVTLLNTTMEYTQVVYNTEEESCFIVSSTVEVMEQYHEELLLEHTELNDELMVEQAEFITPDTMLQSEQQQDTIKFGPLLDFLKLPTGTATSILSNPTWSPPPISTPVDLSKLKRTMTNEFSYDNTTIEYDVDVKSWSRSILVELLPGATSTGGQGLKDVAEAIVEFVKDMAMVPPYSTVGSSPYLRSNNTNGASSSASRVATEALLSTREAFSLTSTDNHDDLNNNSNDSTKKRTFHNPHSIWSSALHHGFESSHGCQVMLDTLEISTPLADTTTEDMADFNNNVEEPLLANFELILHPPSQYMKMAAVESSAWNKYCAVSLLIGLSVHPLVSSVEVGMEVELASMSMNYDNFAEQSNDGVQLMAESAGRDVPELVQHNNERSNNGANKVQGITNPQWIVQSGVPNSRPFFDVGLDGSGQVVAVADGGLDQDNCYFQSSSSTTSSIYASDSTGGWDMSQRKIVHYDDTFGDRTERTDGHGTYVSSILAGRKSVDGGRSEVAGYADGAAPGSKLAFFDMENGYFGIRDSGADRLFKSLYNYDNTRGVKGARVINASWGRSYHGQYTSFCRSYDAFLRNKYPDLLFVVSAGNTGRSGVSSIQDPADCKNPIAVGATLSYGSDLRRDELGIEYLADYSSRGPAKDGRMKPDVCVPGHFVLSARANPDTAGECDGDKASNAAKNELGGPGVKYTTGTSMAAPVLAGSAAILRQYFEEGYCNPTTGKCCGYKGCGSHINPSGSLLKAVLMNGAQPLKGGVQYVPSGQVLQEPEQQLRAYDSNQGMGRVNLANSVPLAGEDRMDMVIVNDKQMVNGGKDIYKLFIKQSNGCKRELSATLAWYDPPGTPGCTRCLVNDMDVSIKRSSGTTFANGRRNRDSINTVERVQTEVTNGEEVRVIVDATNLAQYGQKYSLVITGCFSTENDGAATPAIVARSPQTRQPTNRPSKQPTKQPSKQPTNRPNEAGVSAYSSSVAEVTTTDCSERMFKVALSTGKDGSDLSWSLIGSTNQGGIERLISGGGSGTSKNQQYLQTACLDSGTRYRFQVKNTARNNISGRYKLTYGGKVIFIARNGMGRTSTFRFKIEEDGSFTQLGSNAFETHVKVDDETEVPVIDLMLSEATYGSNDGSLQQAMHDEDSRDDSNDSPSAWNNNAFKGTGRGMLDDDEPEDENELEGEWT